MFKLSPFADIIHWLNDAPTQIRRAHSKGSTAIAMEEKRFTREAFYELVWSKPAIKLAPELGISDAAITKICRRYRIPKPGVGDWNLVAAGYKITKPKLPPPKDGERKEIVIWPTEKLDRLATTPLSESILQLIEKERLPENRISVSDQPEITDSVLRRSQQLLKKAETDIYGRLTLPLYKQERLPISLAVSADSLNRSLKIYDVLFKAVVHRGHSVNAAKLRLCKTIRRASSRP